MGCQFAELDWGGLLDARADMYIVVVAEMAAKEARLRWGSYLTSIEARHLLTIHVVQQSWRRGNPDTQGDYSKGQVRTPTSTPTVVTLWGKTNGNTSRPR